MVYPWDRNEFVQNSKIIRVKGEKGTWKIKNKEYKSIIY